MRKALHSDAQILSGSGVKKGMHVPSIAKGPLFCGTDIHL